MSESGKPDPWKVRKADGTEIRVPTRALLESWILAGVVEPEDKVARPGQDSYVLVRELQDLSDAVETGSVVHGPRTVPTHPPVFAVVGGPETAPPPVPGDEADVLELEPLEGDTIQDAPVVEEREPVSGLGVARTRVAEFQDDLTAPDYPSDAPADGRQPPEGATLDEMLPELATAPQPTEPAPRTGRVAVAPTTLAPLIVEGNYVSDQAVDPSEGSGVHVPHIGADGEVIEGRKGANRTGRIAVGATDIDAARQEMELQSTYPERSGIPDPHDHPTQPSVEKVTARPDVSLKRSDDSPKPSALHRTLNKTPSAPAATEALSRPIQRAGALGGVYSEDLEIRALQRERRRTVTITISLFLVIGAAGALWWSRGESAEPAPEPTASAEKTADQASTGAAPKKPEAPAEEPTAEEPLENAVAQVADQDTAAEAKTPSEADSEPAEPADSETSESDEQKKAAETARLEAAAAIDEEIDSESLALDENPTSKKKAKKGKKGKSSEGSGSSVKGYESLIRAAKKLRRKQPSKALALYKQALAQRPSSPDALINVGRLQMKSGKTAAAIKTFKRCRKAMPRYTPCMYSHGRALEKAGRRSDAMKAYENYLDVNPDGSQAADVRKRLSR